MPVFHGENVNHRGVSGGGRGAWQKEGRPGGEKKRVADDGKEKKSGSRSSEVADGRRAVCLE